MGWVGWMALELVLEEGRIGGRDGLVDGAESRERRRRQLRLGQHPLVLDLENTAAEARGLWQANQWQHLASRWQQSWRWNT